MDKEYVNMLADSLRKKDGILKSIISLSNEQTELIKEESVDWDRFNEIVSEKETLIEEINQLDEGFDTLFNRVKDEINANKSQYIGEIATMKVLIKAVTEKAAEIEVIERRNKTSIEGVFANTKKTIKQSKLGNKAAAQYYQRMNRINTIDPQLMDKKS